jgi:hypothetical protein
MTNFVLEHELTELRDNLDAAADIVTGVCCNDPSDDLNWTISVLERATNFVTESLDRLKDGAEQ